MRDTIDMACESDLLTHIPFRSDTEVSVALKAFEALVRADERSVEREALLEIVYSYCNNLSWNDDFQEDIRARGNT